MRTPLPGAVDVEFVIHVAPQLGAEFTQMTAEFKVGGQLGPTLVQRFLYVLDGQVTVEIKGEKHNLLLAGMRICLKVLPHIVSALTDARAAVD